MQSKVGAIIPVAPINSDVPAPTGVNPVVAHCTKCQSDLKATTLWLCNDPQCPAVDHCRLQNLNRKVVRTFPRKLGS